MNFLFSFYLDILIFLCFLGGLMFVVLFLFKFLINSIYISIILLTLGFQVSLNTNVNMLLFSIINLNVSGVFVYLSYSPIMFIYFIFIVFVFFGISLWTFTFDIINICVIVYLLVFSIYFLLVDILTDTLYGINEVSSLHSTIQYCFIWFVLSEAALFLSFFWAGFVLNLLVTLEFSTIISALPTQYATTIATNGFVFYWFYLDMLNIIINSMLLFFSGIFCNLFYILLNYNNICVSIYSVYVSLIMGFLFIWNQLWEFSLLTFNISTNSFCTTLLCIDLLHCSHVTLGVFLLFISTINIYDMHVSHNNIAFLTCIIFYWHFVDLVWFLLLSFLYFNILCVLFLI